jgi:hypothetical protein
VATHWRRHPVHSQMRFCRSQCARAHGDLADGRKRLPLTSWHAFSVIGRLEKTVIDCPDPRALTRFYCQVLGMTINEDIDG